MSIWLSKHSRYLHSNISPATVIKIKQAERLCSRLIFVACVCVITWNLAHASKLSSLCKQPIQKMAEAGTGRRILKLSKEKIILSKMTEQSKAFDGKRVFCVMASS
jgi:hypothetical protein